MPRVYALSGEEIERILLPINGQGGMQNYLKRLQQSLDGNLLTVSDRLFGTTCCYIERMGCEGGWQYRIPRRLMDDALDDITAPRKNSSIQ